MRADADAQVIARVLHVEHLVGLWISESEGSVQVGLRPLLSGTSRQVAVLLAAHDAHDQAYQPAALSAAVEKLLHAPEPIAPPSAAMTVLPPSAAALQAPSASDVAARAAEPTEEARPLHEQTHPLAGAALALLGAGGMVTGWVLYADRQSLRTPLVFTPGTYASFRDRGPMALLAGGLGAGVLALSDYLWLPNQAGTPGWSYAVGAAGLALGATGAGFAIFGQHCEIGAAPVACQGFTADSTFGPMLALQSLPLLAVPITYLLRKAVHGGTSHLQVSAEVHDRAASFSLQGRF